MEQAERPEPCRIVVRPATMDDLDDIMVIENASYSAPWSRESIEAELRPKQGIKPYFCVEMDGHFAGYIGAHYFAEEAHIVTVAVAPRFRGKGLGELLVLALLHKVFALGANFAILEYRVSNTPAENLYRKIGFAPISIRKRYYYDNNEDAVVAVLDDLGTPERQARLHRLYEQWKERYSYDVHVAF